MKNNLMVFILALTSFVGFKANAGGVYVGNGGDAVFCQTSSESRYEGYYALDYLMTWNFASPTVLLRSWDESKTRLRKMLANGYPALLTSFDNFLADLNNQSDWTKKRIWLPAPQGLVDISDEQIRRKLPVNCGVSEKGQGVSLIQAVVRTKQPNIIRYEYDSEILYKLESRATQLSYLYIHEWLWDHSQDPQVIRWANQFLHTSAAEFLSPKDFKKSLDNIGIQAKTPDLL